MPEGSFILINAENVGGEVVTSLKASYLRSVLLVKDETDLLEMVRDGISRLRRELGASPQRKAQKKVKVVRKPRVKGTGPKRTALQAPIIKAAIAALCVPPAGTTGPDIYRLAVEEGKATGVKIGYDNIYHSLRPLVENGTIVVDKSTTPYRYYPAVSQEER